MLLNYLLRLSDIASAPRSPVLDNHPDLRSFLVAAALRRDEFEPDANIPISLLDRPGEPSYSIDFLAVQIGALVQDVVETRDEHGPRYRLLLPPLRMPSALAAGPENIQNIVRELAFANALEPLASKSIAIKGIQLEGEVMFATALVLAKSSGSSVGESLCEFKDTKGAEIRVHWNFRSRLFADLTTSCSTLFLLLILMHRLPDVET